MQCTAGADLLGTAWDKLHAALARLLYLSIASLCLGTL